MKTITGIILGICFTASAFSQRSLSVSVSNTASFLPPASFSAVWSQPIHPGICLGYEFHWKQESPWFQSAKFGLYYHQLVQTGIQLYSEFGYRKSFKSGVFASTALSLGYLHAVTLTEQVKLNSSGAYEVINAVGRPQLMFGPAFETGYKTKMKNRSLSFFLNYHIWLQTPFVPGYVPLLPNGSVHLGARISISKQN